MTKWTAENTEGFTTEELAVMNEAQERIEAQSGADESNIADFLNNAFLPGVTADDLVAQWNRRA